MATHESSVKRARQDLKKKARNSQYDSAVRTAVKKFKMAVNGSGIELSKAQDLFSSAQALLARAAQKGILHQNNASRRIQRMARLLKSLAPSTAAGVEATVMKAVSSLKAKKPAAPKASTAKKTAAKSTAKKSAAKSKKK